MEAIGSLSRLLSLYTSGYESVRKHYNTINNIPVTASEANEASKNRSAIIWSFRRFYPQTPSMLMSKILDLLPCMSPTSTLLTQPTLSINPQRQWWPLWLRDREEGSMLTLTKRERTLVIPGTHLIELLPRPY